MAWRAGYRRLVMGLSTLAGRPRGFFSPYRHAASVAPTGYPELARLFEAASVGLQFDGPAQMQTALDQAERAIARVPGIGGPPPAPRWAQSWYPGLDGAGALGMVLSNGPRRIVEVGSGHSTRFLAAAAGVLNGGVTAIRVGRTTATEYGGREVPVAITCIDPQPRAALAGLDVDWRREVLGERHLSLFRSLQPGDIAFFDSSHLLWPGSDVDLILNRILPVLVPGVLVHLHDVFLPDAYPGDWAWRGYTEQLGIAGWLAGGGMELLWSSHWIRSRMDLSPWPGLSALPLPAGARESALWLRVGRPDRP